MAAGKGKRMLNPDMAKVMYAIGGMPMIGHVITCAKNFGSDRIVVIVGHQRESVVEYVHSIDPTIEIAVQAEQLGTGHAIMQTEPLLSSFTGDVVILSGDVPLLRAETVAAMIEHQRKTNAIVTALTTILDDPSGYGRVIRDDAGSIRKIVEHKDANENELLVREINTGIYVFDARHLFDALRRVTNDNAQGEYYLTDVFEIFARAGLRMEPFVTDSFDEIRGVNTKAQLEEMEGMYLTQRLK